MKEGPPPGGPGGPTIDVRAEALAFDTDEIDLPAGTPATIRFENADAGTTHNIAIYTDDTVTTAIWDGPDLLGPGSVDYPVPPIDAGEYYFHCDTHPTMFGSVVVESAVEAVATAVAARAAVPRRRALRRAARRTQGALLPVRVTVVPVRRTAILLLTVLLAGCTSTGAAD